MSLVQKSNKIIGLFLVLFLMISIVAPVSVFAEFGDGDDVVVSTSGNLTSTELESAIQKANQKTGLDDGTSDKLYVDIKGVPTELAKPDTVGSATVLRIDMDVWNSAKTDDVTASMKYFVDSLSETGASEDAINEFMQMFEDTDDSVSSVMLPMVFRGTKANIYQAYKIVEPFLDILNVVLGVGCVGLILLLMFSTVMDLAYIGLPVWREAQEQKNSGSKKHPFGVSYEALRTVEETEKNLGGGDGEYKNSYLLYFKRRALTYIILAICIMYLICGGLSGIIGFVLNLTSGIV